MTQLTPQGVGGISSFELRGPGLPALLSPHLRPAPSWRPGALSVCRVVDGAQVIDEILIAPLPSDGQESLIRLHCHGGPAIRRSIAEWLQSLGFTWRDVPSAEGLAATNLSAAAVAALPRAVTREAAHSLLAQSNGNNEAFLSSFAQRCASDVEDPQSLEADWRDYIRRSRALIRLLQPAVVAIAGRPNAGKSSLFNTMLRQDRSIVSAQAGTTVDAVQADTAFGAVPVRLTDVPGHRPDGTLVEREGLALSAAILREADFVIYLIDAVEGKSGDDENFLAGMDAEKVMLVETKRDLARGDAAAEARIDTTHPADVELVQRRVAERLLDGVPVPVAQPALFLQDQLKHATMIQGLLNRPQTAATALFSWIRRASHE